MRHPASWEHPGHPVERASRAKVSIPIERSEPGAGHGKRSSQVSKSQRGPDWSWGYLEWSPALVGPDLPLVVSEKHFLNLMRVQFGELVRNTDSGLRSGFKSCLNI